MDSVERGPSRLSRGVGPLRVPLPTLEEHRQLVAQALEIRGDEVLASLIVLWGRLDPESQDEVWRRAATLARPLPRRDEEASS